MGYAIIMYYTRAVGYTVLQYLATTTDALQQEYTVMDGKLYETNKGGVVTLSDMSKYL